jgi:hypothetical protein
MKSGILAMPYVAVCVNGSLSSKRLIPRTLWDSPTRLESFNIAVGRFWRVQERRESVAVRKGLAGPSGRPWTSKEVAEGATSSTFLRWSR